jgi:hypothetical protein
MSGIMSYQVAFKIDGFKERAGLGRWELDYQDRGPSKSVTGFALSPESLDSETLCRRVSSDTGLDSLHLTCPAVDKGH